ncbi:MAG: glutamate 5-kinase [Myxococcaceae bacterium]|nr:glutamate 5-kinase [Myxococcaceae bacterium]
MALEGRGALGRARRVVVKVGTNALTRGTGTLQPEHFRALAAELGELREGRELLIVSSGAIALGVERLQLTSRPRDLARKQACAAAGQSLLMRAWEEALSPHPVGQVLLTHDDLQHRQRYLNARRTLLTLIELGGVPVINENDTVAVEEIRFGDNDALAALVAPLVGADLLIILSDVDGLFDADPRTTPGARRVPEVKAFTPALRALAKGSSSGVGTGGMATKLAAAEKVTSRGVACAIVSGETLGQARALLRGEDVGTLFLPQVGRVSARAHWLKDAVKARGALWLDAGAVAAVVERQKSLLPSGVRKVEGTFARGDPVELKDPRGQVVAKGLVAYASGDLERIKGLKSAAISKVLGDHDADEAVHRDDLVLVGD